MINTAFKQARWILLYRCIEEHILLLQSTPPFRQGGFIWGQSVLENTVSNLKIGNENDIDIGSRNIQCL